jgi:phage-related protein
VRAAIFHPAALDEIRTFPQQIRRALGQAIWELQSEHRLTMPLSRPMPSVARGVEELRVRDASGAYRAFYFLRSQRGVLIFHAFEKKGRKTALKEIKLGQRRMKEMLDEET